MKIKLLFVGCTLLFLASCSSTKQNLSYFEDIQDMQSASCPSSDYEVKIIPDDELIITVTSVVPEATAAFNLPMTNPASYGTVSVNSQIQMQTYMVDKDGDIIFPVLGKLKVSGLSTSQLADKLRSEISKTVKDPFVKIELANFRINVIGEVKNPGAISVNRQRFSLLDAIAQAGDLTEYGLRESVLLIREENGVKTYHRLNLNDSKILSSPYFYLKQNDVIYVEPNKIKKDNSKYNQNNAFKLSVVATIVSALSVVASLVIALAIK